MVLNPAELWPMPQRVTARGQAVMSGCSGWAGRLTILLQCFLNSRVRVVGEGLLELHNSRQDETQCVCP